MKHLLPFTFLCLSACVFHPLYTEKVVHSVCVDSIPERAGYALYQELKTRFPDKNQCLFTLQVQSPQLALSDNSISDKDFTTMQSVNAFVNYKLLDQKKNVVLKNVVSRSSSSAITKNPYSSVVALENTSDNLYPLLADQIALHVAAFLDRNNQ